MAYQFDHQWKEERKRLAALEAAFDPWTVHNLEAIGVKPGWQCLEVGAGGGSIAEWLCAQVGPTGHIVATDVETKFLEAIEFENLEIRKHNIITDPLEVDTYDLIHTRAVLDHLPERDAVTKRILSALRPGGWLTIEGGDFSTVRAVISSSEDGQFFDFAFSKMLEVGQLTGFDPFYGRSLGTVFRREGLVEVSLEGFVGEWDSEHPLAALYRMTFQRLREKALDIGKITGQELDRLLGLMVSPKFRAIGNTVFFAKGRRHAA